MLQPGSSKALGAVHGKGGSHEANSNAVEFVIGIFGTPDYDGLSEEVRCSFMGAHWTVARDNDGECGKKGERVSGEKREAAPAYLHCGGGIVICVPG